MFREQIPNKWVRLVIGLVIAAIGVIFYANTEFPLAIVGLIIAGSAAFITPTYRELRGNKK